MEAIHSNETSINIYSSGCQPVVREPLGNCQNLKGFEEKYQQWCILCSQFDKTIRNMVSFATTHISEKEN
jgi:hypothetical protein